jgi:NAD(P)-dependent dehydrogenase (short-subunit alcohol dehydrogenase family)
VNHLSLSFSFKDFACLDFRFLLSPSVQRQPHFTSIDLTGKHAASILVVPLDLLQYETHASIAARVVKECGRVDVLVNNGGRSQRALVESTVLQVDKDMLALNTVGMNDCHVCDAFVDRFAFAYVSSSPSFKKIT